MKNELKISNDERTWLEEAYNIFKKGEVYDPIIFYEANFDKFSKGFMPEDLNRSLIRPDGITLLGIWLVDPDNNIFEKIEKVIIELKKLVLDKSKRKEFSTKELSDSLNISLEEISKIIQFIFHDLNGFIRSFGGSYEYVDNFEIVKSFHQVRKFKRFVSVEKELEITARHILKQTKSPNRRVVRNIHKGSPHQVTISEEQVEIKRTEKDTAFIIMQIDKEKHELEDVLNTIKEVCKEFNIVAQRADEIEHQDKITDVILNKIDSSEFIIADLSGERPNVYYEVGYAHSKGKRPILIRKEGEKLHFDLSVHNVPEYRSNTELRDILTRRFEAITGRKLKKED
ncbi:MAG: hypothetical protein ED557_07815 [Balneola sp.]|nr:MAG: hypothetical protein ED557_07815 [Balneola sp.]